MYLGFNAKIFSDQPLENCFRLAAKLGLRYLEVACRIGHPHLDPEKSLADNGSSIKELVKRFEVRISALSAFSDHLEDDDAKRKTINDAFKKTIELARILEIPVVNTMAGRWRPEQDSEKKWELFEHEMARLVDDASRNNVKIAVEAIWGTIVYNIPTAERMFKTISSPALGLNYDPSLFVWQFVDHLDVVGRFGRRIYHVHAKDTEVLIDRLRSGGINSGEWWRFRVPGWGEINWPRLLSKLREVGYDYVLSVEHEDPVFGGEEGIRLGIEYLKTCAPLEIR